MTDLENKLANALVDYENIVRIVLSGLKRDYEERGMMVRKEFYDELRQAYANACVALQDAKDHERDSK